MPSVKNTGILGQISYLLYSIFFLIMIQLQKSVVIYAHGFKDLGNFDLIAEKFVAAGYTMVKFNFSHNGTTAQQPQLFTNLQAFGNNLSWGK